AVVVGRRRPRGPGRPRRLPRRPARADRGLRRALRALRRRPGGGRPAPRDPVRGPYRPGGAARRLRLVPHRSRGGPAPRRRRPGPRGVAAVSPADRSSGSDGATSVEETDDGIVVADRWTYRWAASRRPHIHPVRTPAGHVLTRDAPDDHPWHHALWF